jgi:hypothetical protein
MRFWMYVALMAVIFFLGSVILPVPEHIYYLAVMPVFFVLLLYATGAYNFGKSLELEEVPSKGYHSRLRELDGKVLEIADLGFRKIDQFYIKSMPDSVSYVFKHGKDPVFLLLHHFGRQMFVEIFTRYSDDFSLNTSANITSGTVPPLPKNFLQIFPGKAYKYLFERHVEGHEFLIAKGLKPFDIHESEYRFFHKESARENIENIKRMFLWPLRLTFRLLFQQGRVYCRPVMEQEASGFIRIYG